ncbi:hypothetical protein CFP65_1330 [Kitasatospora sp. MMS16-BH015]|uniref:hypothetical protein n=1 Tax=Kitasatospora sp. MMS16-BH015 TaxID=2018025 RepID=UPI000CA3B465|nr:hypothetical protein [Kitasatospora sp. MMS16-BH015]AUG76229.1 hypothetical protein CFP65_1330 [Kitasatospora sp. MMS16-BH015]
MSTVRGTLFHTAVAAPRGDQLLPLAGLRELHPDLYERHLVKYRGREHRLAERVLPLDCTWSEVVFLSPLDAAPLFAALREAGRPAATPQQWTLDAGLLDPARCCVRLMRMTRGAQTADPGGPDDYLPLTTATLRAVAEPTARALDRLRTLTPAEPARPWGDVPHILHRGPIPLRYFDR